MEISSNQNSITQVVSLLKSFERQEISLSRLTDLLASAKYAFIEPSSLWLQQYDSYWSSLEDYNALTIETGGTIVKSFRIRKARGVAKKFRRFLEEKSNWPRWEANTCICKGISRSPHTFVTVSDVENLECAMKIEDIRFPEMRRDLLYYLKLVEDIGSDPESLKTATEDLEYLVHFFFDDTELAINPSEYLGLVLISQLEIEALKGFGSAFNDYIDKTSPGKNPLIFQKNLYWARVKTSALKALHDLHQ